MFCDLSVPTGAQGFSVYEDMRDKLIVRGVPATDIEFIQSHDSDAAKLQLFRDVRSGKVRILFGSTQKLGTGANVQEPKSRPSPLGTHWSSRRRALTPRWRA